jgi:hypothetical protein
MSGTDKPNVTIVVISHRTGFLTHGLLQIDGYHSYERGAGYMRRQFRHDAAISLFRIPNLGWRSIIPLKP